MTSVTDLHRRKPGPLGPGKPIPRRCWTVKVVDARAADDVGDGVSFVVGGGLEPGEKFGLDAEVESSGSLRHGGTMYSVSLRFRMYPTADQAAVMALHCHHARYVWNLALEQHGIARQFGQYADQGAWDRQLGEARKASPWLASGSSSVQQAALRDLRRAFKNWWGNPGHFRPPTWRKAKGGQGFVVRDVTWRRLNRTWGEVTVPKAGKVRFRLSRPIGEHGAARVTLDPAGRWHVSFIAEPQTIDRERTGRTCGIDRGVANTLALEDGRMFHAPGLTDGERAEFVRRQVERAGLRKDDPMREVHRQACSRTYARLADRRRDWIEQTTTALVREFDVIVVEDLNVRGMVRRPKPKPGDQPGEWLPNGARAKAGLNRAILAQCWGEFLRRLKDKASRAGVEIIEVPAANTSRECRECGHISAGNRESQAEFRCKNCGHEAHADTNAARVIRQRGEQPRPGRGQKLKIAA